MSSPLISPILFPRPSSRAQAAIPSSGRRRRRERRGASGSRACPGPSRASARPRCARGRRRRPAARASAEGSGAAAGSQTMVGRPPRGEAEAARTAAKSSGCSRGHLGWSGQLIPLLLSLRRGTRRKCMKGRHERQKEDGGGNGRNSSKLTCQRSLRRRCFRKTRAKEWG